VTDYLDASVILPTLMQEASTEAVYAFIAKAEEPLVVGEFAAAEVASAMSRLVRMQKLTSTDASRRLADFDAWRTASTADLDVQPSDVRLTSLYVRRFDLMLRAPDALHAAICRRADLRLVTLDRRLATAARALGVAVELLQPA
jgi:predicted nucleic acid-binding protein